MRDILNDLDAGWLSDPDPVRRAQIQMKAPLPKRFYKSVQVAEVDTTFRVLLDGRAARTPGGAPIALPTEQAARIVAIEFDAQDAFIDPLTMPTVRLANTAIDGVARNPEAVVDDILRFAGSDLLCYRAGEPDALVARQSAAWDTLLDWVERTLGARFAVAEGVMHVSQPAEAIAAVTGYLTPRREPFRLSALHVMTALTGSALIALAVEAGARDAKSAWDAAHIDEDWQIDHWGQDSEAVARRSARWRDFSAAAQLVAALG